MGHLKNYNKDIELNIIGCILLRPELIKELYLQPKHFMDDIYRRVLIEILEYSSNQDDFNFNEFLIKNNNNLFLQEVCNEALENVVSISNFHFYQEKQEELYKATNITRTIKLYDEGELNYAEMVDTIKKINEECGKPVGTNTMLSPKEIAELITTERNELEFKNFKNIQEKIKLLTNTVNVIAARTSVGKSAFALNLMNDLSNKYKSLYFNMEMTEKEIYQRLVSMNSDVEIDKFANMTNNEPDRMWRAIENITKKKMKIYQGSKNLKALRTILTKESREEHCVVFIDYVGYVYTGKYAQNDRERIGEVVREIQNMSKDLNITVFLIAQINRSGSDEPSLVHIKDSGELEQTGHCVMILHNEDDDINNQIPEIKLKVLKNRSGKLGFMKLLFNKNTQKFTELNY